MIAGWLCVKLPSNSGVYDEHIVAKRSLGLRTRDVVDLGAISQTGGRVKTVRVMSNAAAVGNSITHIRRPEGT